MVLALLLSGEPSVQKGPKEIPEKLGATPGAAGQMLLFFGASALAVSASMSWGIRSPRFF